MAFWANTPSEQSKLNATNLNNLSGGWTKVVETLTYASADSPTFVANTSADLTSYISVGMKLKLTQTTVKYFIVTAITSTTITLYGGTDYTLANASISDVYYSVHKAPYGFPTNPEKWSVTATFSGSSAVSARTAKTIGSITIPIGAWDLYINGYATWQTTANVDFDGSYGLGTTQNTEATINRISYINRTNAQGLLRNNVAITKPNTVYTTKTTLYSNIFMYEPNAGYTGTLAANCVAVCAYI